MKIQFKAGDKVRRKANNRNPWWNKVCVNHNKKPDAIFEVVRTSAAGGGVFLEGLQEPYEYTADYFELVEEKEESEMEKAYARAKSLIGKKIAVSNGFATVEGIIYRQDKTDNVGLSHVCKTFLENNGWVVGVRFNNMNYPVQLVNEVPSEVSITLNSKYTAVVSKDGVKVGCQTFSIEKIKEIIDAYNKL